MKTPTEDQPNSALVGKKAKHIGPLVILLLMLILAGVWMLNWETLDRSAARQSVYITGLFAVIFIPIVICLYIVANRGIHDGKPLGRIWFLVEGGSKIGLWLALVGVVAGLALPAMRPEWTSATSLLFYALPLLCIICILRAVLAAFAEPFMKDNDVVNPPTAGTDAEADIGKK